ncbi:MAG TPA: prepilin-type N-terminal cleavage/methylation domain-containing protein [Candidatus Paceibacterota bacterium]|nr:prepilin-type N-terminal cleavage/methylation domain-containing protein [Candidatus Paceibacterota bacterium]
MSRTSKGYTLVEMLVYIALIALLFSALAAAVSQISKSERRARAFLDINSAAISAFSRFSRDIRRATSIDIVNSTLSASSGKLALIMKNADGTSSTTKFYLSADGMVKVEQDGVYAGSVTSDNMQVSNLTFWKFSQASTTAVRIEMTLAPDASTTVPALNFYGTYVLRGSYLE